MNANTPQMESMPAVSAGEAKARRLLKSALARLRKAQGYMPEDPDHDKEAGQLAVVVREIGRFLG